MITRWTAFSKRVRRALSPTEWFVRWLRLPRCERGSGTGLILVQIDGLSREQLQHAMAAGRMPFLKSLLDREHYQVHDLYSGLPSSTPSVQGELFYGSHCAVPAFAFRDRRTGKIERMYAREIARDVQQRLERDGVGILAGGSAYCNVYGGGARETHFCASSLGWDEVIQAANPLTMATFLTWHLWSALHTAGLVLVELILAFVGFVRGSLTRRNIGKN